MHCIEPNLDMFLVLYRHTPSLGTQNFHTNFLYQILIVGSLTIVSIVFFFSSLPSPPPYTHKFIHLTKLRYTILIMVTRDNYLIFVYILIAQLMQHQLS